MKKKVISLMLATCFLAVPSLYAAEATASTDSSARAEEIAAAFASSDPLLQETLCDDSSIGYWSVIHKLNENSFLSWTLDSASSMVGQLPDERTYAELLSNLMTMQSGSLAEQIQNQGQFDNLESDADYIMDAADLALDLLGDQQDDILVTALGVSKDGLENVILENMESAGYYEIIFQDYSQSHLFLNAVSNYATNETLRNVATSLAKANDSLLLKRLEYLGEAAGNMAEFEANFFLDHLYWDLLKSTDLYQTDETVKFFVDEGAILKESLSGLIQAATTAFNFTILAGDIGFGTTNVYNRYQEMKALADVASALSKAAGTVSIPEGNAVQKEDAIRQKCDYYQALIATHARGEYLLYQLLMYDAGGISDMRWLIEYITKPENSTDDWYAGQVRALLEFENLLNNLFAGAEQSQWLVTSKKTYSATGDLKSETSYTYTADGLLAEENTGGMAHTYQYDENGCVTVHTVQNNYDTSGGNYRELICKEDGTVLCTIFRLSDGTEQSRLTSAEYETYAGPTNTRIVQGWSDPTETREEFEYDAQGNTTKITTYYNGDWSSTCTQEYDSHNNIIRSVSEGDVADAGETTYEYTYDDAGRILTYTRYFNETLSETYTREYTEDGYTENAYSYAIEWAHAISSYASDGKLLQSTDYDENGNPILTISYTYDERGNVLQEDWSGSILTHEYIYDDAGNIIRDETKQNGLSLGYVEYTYAEFPT